MSLTTPAAAAPMASPRATGVSAPAGSAAADADGFAQLFALAATTLPAGAPAAADPAADLADDASAPDPAAGDAPQGAPLLNWLFGLMTAVQPRPGTPVAPEAEGAPPATGPAAPTSARASSMAFPLATQGLVAPRNAAAPGLEVAVAALTDAPAAPSRTDAPLPPAAAAVPAPLAAPLAGAAADPSGQAAARVDLPEAAAAAPLPARFEDWIAREAEPVPATDPSGSPFPRVLPEALPPGSAPLSALSSALPSTPSALALDPLAAGFVDDLGERIEWQLSGEIGEADIELHPAELGALKIRIETQGDQARVHIIAAEAATRVLLTQAMPQLRDLLTGSGLQLARSQVDADSRRETRGDDAGPSARAMAPGRRRVTGVVLVDAYV